MPTTERPVKPSFESLCVHEREYQVYTRPQQLPLFATAAFRFESLEQGAAIFKKEQTGDVYSRYGNPTTRAVEEKMAALESFGTDAKAKAIMCSSGMSAITTLLLALLKPGDKILTQGNLYGGTTDLLNQVLTPLDIKPVFVNLKDLDAVEDTLSKDKRIRMIYCESPANPTLACVDLKAVAGLAKQHGIYATIDNTFCTPYLQRPFRFGFDFIIHSTTKYLNGHGNSVAGMLVGRDPELMSQEVWTTMKLTGSNVSPFDAWLVNIGLKTLPLRMDKHCRNAMGVAQFLEQHPRIEKVNYPGLPSHPDHELAKKQMSGFGGMISFEIAGGLEAGIRFMNKVQFCSLAPSLGDIDTLILHPASMSHVNVPKKLRLENGITDGLIRLSIGIENAGDIIADLEQALKTE